MKEISRCDCSFEEIRDIDSIYVDKTKDIYNLVEDEVNYYYFITRPSGFGKSLMCSTLHSLFEGKRELFKGLYIANTDYAFEKYPVLHFDFSNIKTDSFEEFRETFQNLIIEQAAINGFTVERKAPSQMLLSILDSYDGKVVIIIDEYDYPLVHATSDMNLYERIKNTFSTFYSVIKNTGEKIRFVFITGVVRLTSVLYAINNITDITFDENYAATFGYTEEELLSNFSSYINEYMARDERKYETREDFLEAIREYYGGYRFSYRNETKVYNPITVRKFFSYGCCFEPYWENTDVSTVAVELVSDFHLERMISEKPILPFSVVYTFDYSLLSEKRLRYLHVFALIFFTGAMTIADGDTEGLDLTFPNAVVRYSFRESLKNKSLHDCD